MKAKQIRKIRKQCRMYYVRHYMGSSDFVLAHNHNEAINRFNQREFQKKGLGKHKYAFEHFDATIGCYMYEVQECPKYYL